MATLDRRTAMLALGVASIRLRMSAADPWQARQPSEWNVKDIQKILNDSPWARLVSVSLHAVGDKGTSMGGGRGAANGPGERYGGGELAAAPPVGTFLVRWDSARPIKEALVRSRMGAMADISPQAKEFLEREERQYVISLVAVEPRRDGGERHQPGGDMLNRIKAATALQRRGHNMLHPAAVVAPKEGPAILTYYFPKTDPIVLEDKEVEFATHAAPAVLRTNFRLKTMVFQGQLAL